MFADQNLITDPPFSKLDVVCCRNLLIYLKPDVQEKVIALFHFALKANGVLMLGSAETIGRQTDLFQTVGSGGGFSAASGRRITIAWTSR